MRQAYPGFAMCLLISEKPPQEQSLLESRRMFHEQSPTENNQLPLINYIHFYCITDGFKPWLISLSNTEVKFYTRLLRKTQSFNSNY